MGSFLLVCYNCRMDKQYILQHDFGYDRCRPLHKEAAGAVLATCDSVMRVPARGEKSFFCQLRTLLMARATGFTFLLLGSKV